MTQLTLRRYKVERVVRGERPVFEFDLEPNARIVSVKFYGTTDYEHRSTVDHYVTVWVEVTL